MASKRTINKTFICESTYFNCEQVVRTEIHLMKMYKLCKKVQRLHEDFIVSNNRDSIGSRTLHKFMSNYKNKCDFIKDLCLKNDIGMKIKVIDNERIF